MGDVLFRPSGTALDRSLEAETIDEREPTVFSVLAERARGHPRSHLWGAALFGAADAIAVLIAYPSAWWIATAALMLCAFGVWGLADDVAVGDVSRESLNGTHLTARVIRAGALGVGIVSALVTAFGFIAAALGTLIS